MASFKNIKVKMKGGKSRMQRVKVLASGKYKFVKNLTKSKTSKGRSATNPRTSEKKARKVRKMTKKKRRNSSGMTFPLAVIAPLAAGLGEPVLNMVADPSPESIKQSLNHIALIYTGYNVINGHVQPEMLNKGLIPLVIGLCVHKFVGGAPLNLNRILARAKVPFIRI